MTMDEVRTRAREEEEEGMNLEEDSNTKDMDIESKLATIEPMNSDNENEDEEEEEEESEASNSVAQPPKGQKFPELDEYADLCAQLESAIYQESSLQPISASEQDWLTPRRLYNFLKARKFKIAKALKMITSCLLWRRSFQPHLISITQPLETCNQKGFIYVNYETDKEGRPLLFINLKNDHHEASPETKLSLMLYMLEGVIKITEKKQKNAKTQIQLIINVEGVTRKQIKIQVIKLLLNTMQNNYPETLGGCAIVNLPSIFGHMFKVISLMMDKETKNKINILCTPSKVEDDPTTGRPRSRSISSIFGGRTRRKRATSDTTEKPITAKERQRFVRNFLHEKLGHKIDIDRAFPPSLGGSNGFVFDSTTFYTKFDAMDWY